MRDEELTKFAWNSPALNLLEKDVMRILFDTYTIKKSQEFFICLLRREDRHSGQRGASNKNYLII